MQVCPNCGSNVEGKFCTSCGTKVVEGAQTQAANQEVAATSGAVQSTQQPNQYLEQGKQISKGFWDFFLTIVKNPTGGAQNLNHSAMTNGIITIILFSLFIPLINYFGPMGEMAKAFGEASFGDFVAKPAFYILLFMAFTVAVLFAVLKMGGHQVSFQDVIGRFGGFMVLPLAIIVVALLLAIINTYTVMGYAAAVAIISMFVAITLTLYSFKRNQEKGLDAFYSTLIVYVALAIFLRIMVENMFIDSFFSNPLGF